MEEENHHIHLRRPLLSSGTTSTSTAIDIHIAAADYDDYNLISPSNSSVANNILIRLSFVLLLVLLSLFANHEASKGFAITILNNESTNKRFQLLYVSNDEATSLVFKASQSVESLLYPEYYRGHKQQYMSHHNVKKHVSHIVLKLSSQNLTDDIVVSSGSSNHEFILTLSPSVMESKNIKHAMAAAVLKGMARVWLWDGQSSAPVNLISGIVEYMTGNDSGGSPYATTTGPPPESCWKHRDTRVVSNFISYCERRRPGFLRRLNQAMRDGWDDGLLVGALGQPVENACTAEHESLRYDLSSV